MDARDTETPAAHRGGETATTKLSRIAERARREPKAEFTSLYHLMNEELLRDCFQRGKVRLRLRARSPRDAGLSPSRTLELNYKPSQSPTTGTTPAGP